METPTILAKRINNGQSEIWLEADTEARQVVATNSILYPVRTLCPVNDLEAFQKAFADGPTVLPPAVAERLFPGLKLKVMDSSISS
jgi:hypothetical protein